MWLMSYGILLLSKLLQLNTVGGFVFIAPHKSINFAYYHRSDFNCENIVIVNCKFSRAHNELKRKINLLILNNPSHW